MVNPIAVIMIGVGILLSMFGIVLMGKRRKIAGIVILVCGLSAITFPFLVSAYLSGMGQ